MIQVSAAHPSTRESNRRPPPHSLVVHVALSMCCTGARVGVEPVVVHREVAAVETSSRHTAPMPEVSQTVLENVAAGRTSAAVAATVLSVDDPICFVADDAVGLRLAPVDEDRPLPRVLPLDRLVSDEFSLRQSAWSGGNVLYIAPRSQPYAVYVRWSRDWQFRGWYVNLQRPMMFLDDRWVTEDQFLDVLVDIDGCWSYKDEDELGEAVAIGRVSLEAAEEIRSTAEQVVPRITRRDWPFCSSVAAWRPDPNWVQPVIPPHWRPTG